MKKNKELINYICFFTLLNREKNQANIKKFIEEQKNQGFKQNKVLYCTAGSKSSIRKRDHKRGIENKMLYLLNLMLREVFRNCSRVA
jgi:hypothetical protein